MKRGQAVHTALDELRMQMLGAQVLFGFQLRGIFEDTFKDLSPLARAADLTGFGLIVVTLSFLIAPPAQHRLVEHGIATKRIFSVTGRFAQLALGTYTVAIGLDVYAVMESYFGAGASAIAAIAAAVVALLLWFGLGLAVRERYNQGRSPMPEKEEPELPEKINQMLTEARVVLPGAQALLGFQFIVTLTKAFHDLPAGQQNLHFLALGFVLLAIGLLISPAAVHRVGFHGRFVERMHGIGSLLITTAMVPLAAGIATDLYVALSKADMGVFALVGGIGAFILFMALWYALPLWIRGSATAR
ncbi:MAG: hypothetical protein JO348_11195 [Alphaproteobacteria bacterium]|nr:hypothetical protein [Alphaproteobacteria bacterium]MBV9420326.1 hypothetical protein [Alphaproteobacteria bacterium]